MRDVLHVAKAVALPAMRAVFNDGEVSSFELRYTDDESGGSVRLLLTAQGEAFRDNVVQGGAPHMSDEEWRERLRSNLVDFVAESRFGWGENRDVR